MRFRIVGPGDEDALLEVFSDIDETFFRPHPFTAEQALELSRRKGRDVYAILTEHGRPVAYGMLRGWDEGFAVPSLGIAVRRDSQRRGLGRAMMEHLHAVAAERGATGVRLRVHPANDRARRLYEGLGYAYDGEERGELVMVRDLGAGTPDEDHAAGRHFEASLLSPDDPRWSSFLEAAPHDFYHLPAYVALSATHEDGDARALLVEDGTGRLLLPVILRRISAGGLDVTSPYGYPGPLVDGSGDPGFLRRAMVSAMVFLRRMGVVTAFVRLHPILNATFPEGIGTLAPHGETISVDLTQPEARLWAETRVNHRRDITRAIRLGYVAGMDESWDHYETFKRLYRATMDRRLARKFYFFDDAYFDGLREALEGRLHLCVLSVGDDIAAAGLFVETSGIVQYHLSGTDQDFAQAQPTKLMMDFVRRWAKERGDVRLHLGGGLAGRDDSLMHFKAGFSPLRHPFCTLRIVLDEDEYARLVAGVDADRDPQDRSGYFPAYRIP